MPLFQLRYNAPDDMGADAGRRQIARHLRQVAATVATGGSADGVIRDVVDGRDVDLGSFGLVRATDDQARAATVAEARGWANGPLPRFDLVEPAQSLTRDVHHAARYIRQLLDVVDGQAVELAGARDEARTARAEVGAMAARLRDAEEDARQWREHVAEIVREAGDFYGEISPVDVAERIEHAGAHLRRREEGQPGVAPASQIQLPPTATELGVEQRPAGSFPVHDFAHGEDVPVDNTGSRSSTPPGVVARLKALGLEASLENWAGGPGSFDLPTVRLADGSFVLIGNHTHDGAEDPEHPMEDTIHAQWYGPNETGLDICADDIRRIYFGKEDDVLLVVASWSDEVAGVPPTR